MQDRVDTLAKLKSVVVSWIEANGSVADTAELKTDNGFLYCFLLREQFSAMVHGYIITEGSIERVWLKAEVALCDNLNNDPNLLYVCMNLNRSIPHCLRIALNEPYLILSYFTDTNCLSSEAVWENLVHLGGASLGIFTELKKHHPAITSYIGMNTIEWKKAH